MTYMRFGVPRLRNTEVFFTVEEKIPRWRNQSDCLSLLLPDRKAKELKTLEETLIVAVPEFKTYFQTFEVDFASHFPDRDLECGEL
jgi:hypothetical protein